MPLVASYFKSFRVELQRLSRMVIEKSLTVADTLLNSLPTGDSVTCAADALASDHLLAVPIAAPSKCSNRYSFTLDCTPHLASKRLSHLLGVPQAPDTSCHLLNLYDRFHD